MSDRELPITSLDDYPWHQTMAPFPLPSTSDTRFNDGYYWGFYSAGWFAFFGMRLYPNTNVIDGYAGAVVGGEQRIVRARRGPCVRGSASWMSARWRSGSRRRCSASGWRSPTATPGSRST